MGEDASVLLDAIYEAGAAPELWPRLLQTIGERSGAVGGMIFSLTSSGTRVIGTSRVEEVMREFISAGWMEHNVRAQRALELKYPGFQCDTDFHSESQMLQMPMYRDFLVPRGMVAATGSVIVGNGDEAIFVTFEGFPSHDLARSAIRSLDQLRPHLARAAVLSAQLGLQRARAMATALEIVGVAAAVLDARGKLRAANGLFEGKLGSAILDSSARLKIADPAADAQLVIALKQLPWAGGRSIAIRCTDEQPPAVIHVLPIRGHARDVFSNVESIIVFSEARLPGSVGSDILQNLFDLTPAEALVARGIAEGSNTREIARAQSVSDHTVRNHLKAIFPKVGVNRQAELVLLLQGLRSPL